jgi:23S rRNA (cytidine1920-2'-O)/16S rRNA (cytidine1409-2'-O)-methyltransferase
LAATRARAQAAIKAGQVRCAGRLVEKPSEPVPPGAEVTLAGPFPYVSRAALKLMAALDAFRLSPEDKEVLDIGASTGGFTQVALERGARRVVALDVGHGQLHESVRADPRVVLIEGLNARALRASDLPAPPQFVCADVSFISLTLALPPALALAAPNAVLVALIKPQFEAGREALGKGGIVRDPAAHALACERVQACLERSGWRTIGRIESPLLGGDGNKEFLIGARHV